MHMVSSPARRRIAPRQRVRVVLLALIVAAVAVGFAWAPGSPVGGLGGVASAHALLVRSEPSADQVVSAPPPQVRMWFSEDLNPLTSKATVVDTTNREVDRQDSHVNASNSKEMDISLQLIPAGTYVVAWRTQSATDGHIVGGSFIFRVARPDGSVPPLPKVLPTGHVVGGGGSASGSGTLDAPTVVQALGTWLSELLLAFWVGGLLWETWILSPVAVSSRRRPRYLQDAVEAACRRFDRIAPYALVGVLLADVLIVLGQTAELAGSLAGAFSPVLLRAVLFGSHFGAYWWLRQAVALAALAVVFLSRRYGWSAYGPYLSRGNASATDDDTTEERPDAVPDWRREAFRAAARVPALPRHLVASVRARSWLGRGQLVLAAALIVAFALSGHAAAVPANQLGLELTSDLLHLLATSVWVGGLLYISAVLVPALRDLDDRTRASVLARGLPEFSALALVSVVVLAASGTINTTVHLTSIQQFVTTAYGLTLFVKIELFLLMVVLSAYHAFVLRPRLAAALEAEAVTDSMLAERATVVTAEKSTVGASVPVQSTSGAPKDSLGGALPEDAHVGEPAAASTHVRTLANRLEDWLRREAMLGVAVLACVALLGAFAGTLAAPAQGASSATSSSSEPAAPYNQTHTVAGYSLTLQVVPATFGKNTFTLTVKDAQGKPVSNASALIQTTMLDMDMGTQSAQLKPVTGQPGVYSGESDLTMAGHWQITVKVLPPNASQFVQSPFDITANV